MISVRRLIFPFCLLFSLVLFFLISTQAYAATYYVDATNGNDSNLGTSEGQAWKTIAKVNGSSFLPGDNILFKRGETWREQLIVPSSGTAGNPITFGAYGGGERPRIDSEYVITYGIWIEDKSYLIFRDIEMRGFQEGFTILSGSKNIILDNVLIHDITNRGVFSHGAAPFDKGYPEYIEIKNSVFHHNGVNTAGADISFGTKVTNSHIHDNTLYGSDTGDAGVDGVVFSEASSGHVIERNTIYNHQQEDGIDLKGVDSNRTVTSGEYSIIRNNVVYGHLSQTGITVQMGTQKVKIYNNKIYGNSTGIWAREYSADNVYSDTKDIYIFNNLIYDNVRNGITTSQYFLGNLYIYNNILARNGDDGDLGGETGIQISSGENVFIKNNIFYKNRPNSGSGAYKSQLYISVSKEDIVLDYNMQYWPDYPSILYFDNGYRTFFDLRANYNQEINGMETDPLFADLNNDGFALVQKWSLLIFHTIAKSFSIKII